MILFDLDGTLVDSLDDIANACDAVLSELGLPIPPRDEYRRYIGDGAAALISRALAEQGAAFREDALARFRARYAAHLVVRTAAYPGIPELLRKLWDAGVPTAVLSNKPDALTLRVVDAVFPAHRFGVVAGERPDVARKPDPAGAIRIARLMSATLEGATLVGDTAVDIATARAAGMRSIGVTWGFRPGELESADAIAADAAELTALLGAR